MNFDDAEIKLLFQELTKIDLQLCATIRDIRDADCFETLTSLNQIARELVEEIKERLKALEKLAEEQDKETDKIAILREVENCRRQLESSQQNLRKSNIATQLALETSERAQLINETAARPQSKSKSTKQEMAKDASHVTESLMSLNRQLASQLQASEHTNATLLKSSHQVIETHEELKSMTGHVHNSRKLLTKYGRREVTDKLVIFLALVFFFSTVIYIVKKRMFAGSFLQSAESYVRGNTDSSHPEL